jgi:hypothetical protein
MKKMKKQKIFTIGILLLGLFFWQSERSLTELVVENFLETPVAVASTQKSYQIKSTSEVGTAWGEISTGFDFIEAGDYQFAAYYGGDGFMTVSGKRVDESSWSTKKLSLAKNSSGGLIDNKIGCDSHNYVTIAVDKGGYLHVSGNMHTSPLIYYRSSVPYDVNSLQFMQDGMIGSGETSTTYPKFIKDKNGDLFFTYRQGSSGNGVNYFNKYALNNQQWTRLTDQPIFASAPSEGTANAYPTDYFLGDDGYFHVAAMWRKTTSASTNYALTYAKTNNFKDFLKSGGSSITLPMSQLNMDSIELLQTDGSGLINSAQWLQYAKTDSYNGPVLFYHKYENNLSQIFMAYLQGGQWQRKKITNFNCKWDFSGQTGSLVNQVSFQDFSVEDNQLKFSYSYSFSNCNSTDIKGIKTALINTANFEVSTINYVYPYKFSADMTRKESTVAEVVVRTKIFPTASNKNELNFLKWETLPGHND